MPAYQVFGIFDENINKFINTVVTLENFPILKNELIDWFYDQGANSYQSHHWKAWYGETRKNLEDHNTIPKFLRSSILGYTFSAFTLMEEEFFKYFKDRFPKSTHMGEFVMAGAFFASFIIIPIKEFKDFYKLEAEVMNTLQNYRDTTTATDAVEYRKQMAAWIYNKFIELGRQKKYAKLAPQIEAHLKFTQAFVENTTPSLSSRSLAVDSVAITQDSPSLFGRRLTGSPPPNTSPNITGGVPLGQSSRALVSEHAHSSAEESPIATGMTLLGLGQVVAQRSNSGSSNSSNGSTASTSPPSTTAQERRVSTTSQAFFVKQQQAAKAASLARLTLNADPESGSGKKTTPPRTPTSTTNRPNASSPANRTMRPGGGGG